MATTKLPFVSHQHRHISFAVCIVLLILLVTPQLSRGFLFLGDRLLIAGREQLLLPVARVAVLLDPEAEQLMRLGKLYVQAGQREKAEQILTEAVIADPTVRGVHYELARTLFVQGNYAQALSRLGDELTRHPDNLKALYLRGLTYSYLGYWDEASADFSAFIAATPFAPWARIDLSWGYLATGKYNEAETVLREVVKNVPNNPWALNNLGLALMNQGRYDEANMAFAQTVSAIDVLEVGQFLTAYPEASAQQFPRSRAQLRRGVGFNIAVLAENRGNTAQAIQLYQQVVADADGQQTIGDIPIEVIQGHVAELQARSAQ